MKELSIEEKAKRYDEAIKRAREYDFSLTGVCVGDIIEDVFPELAESENEKMIQYFKDLAPFDKADELYEKYGFSHKDAIAWLEKQGEKKSYASETMNEKGDFDNGFTRMVEKEQKPAWSEEDERLFISTLWHIKNSVSNGGKDRGEFEIYNWLKSLKDKVQPQQKQGWSEEDENHVKSILSTIECCKAQFPNAQAVVEAYNADIDWLKSLKDKVQQQEQMWSIEDEYNQAFIIEMLYGLEDKDKEYEKKCRKMAEWLKSLRPQKRWKPSEEMLEALYRAIPENVMEISEDEMLLDKLYQGLKYGRVLSNK